MKYWDILNGISKYLPKFGFVSFEGLWNSLKITSKMRYCQIMETLIPQPVWLLFRQHCTDTKQGMIPWWKPRSPSIFSCHGFHWKIKLSSLSLFCYWFRDIVRNSVHASEHDSVIFCGSGTTAAVHKLIHALNLERPPVSLLDVQ